jgi:hypothetical protein
MIKNYFIDHPFHIVAITTTIFMFFLFKDTYKWRKHQKHMREIEEKKKKKALKS